MKFILIILLLVVLLLLIAIIRTLLLEKKTTFYDFSNDEKRVDEYSNILSKMIQYESVSDPNNPQVEKFQKFHQVLQELFPLVFAQLEKIDIDGNLLMKWKGSDSSIQPIVFTSHLDVVPAEGEWKYEPFSGTVAEGKVWGRGAADIKSNVFAFYQAVEELLKQGYTPRCDVYLASSCTEEIGGDGASKIAYWFIERNIKPFVLTDEGGAIVTDPFPGVKGQFAAIGIFEKGYGDIKFYAKSNGGHSSSPSRHNPIARLAAFENYVETHVPFKVKFSPAVEAMFSSLAPYSNNFFLKVVMCNLWLFKPILKKVLPAISAEAAAMLQTTFVFTMQKGSDGYNVIPQEAYATANLRYIPHENSKASNKKIIDIAKRFDVDAIVLKSKDSSKEIDLNCDAYKQTVDVIHKVFPGIGIMPYVVTGGTDSAYYSACCDNCIRFCPIIYGDEQLKGMHGLNECVDQGCLPPAVDYFIELVKAQENR